MLTKPRNLALACMLSAMAGYVDGIGFIHLGGLFVSFMSGNSTRLGVSIAEGHHGDAATAASLLMLFIVGSALGSLIMQTKIGWRQSAVLLAEGALLSVAASAAVLDWPHVAVAIIVVAMGLENAVFQIDGGVGLALTYMTGALVKVGQSLAHALRGGPLFAFAPNLGLWAALVSGACIGALAYQRFELAAIWFAAAVAFALAAFTAFESKSVASRV